MQLFNRGNQRRHGVLLEHPLNDDRRCRECDGACCRSFPSVGLTWQEFKRLRELGAFRLHFDFRGHYLLIIDEGCEFLLDGRCSIYADRPDICRRFFCRD